MVEDVDIQPAEAKRILRAAKWRVISKGNDEQAQLKYKGRWMDLLFQDWMRQLCTSISGSSPEIKDWGKFAAGEARYGARLRKRGFVVVNTATDG